MDTPAESLVATCPNCQKSYAVKSELAGKTATCRQCKQPFVIQPQPKSAAPASTAPATTSTAPANPNANPSSAGAGAALLCPVCQSPTAPGEPVTACPACQTVHHSDCWDYNKGCGLYGCKQAPETEKLQEIEIPASYWGQTEKQCPRCAKVIQAAAVRCRYCGVTFETARPQDVAEFTAKEGQKSAIILHRRIGVVLLILAIIPCCSPVAAIGGTIWYLIARKHIAAMPPLYATICRLAVGIAIGVSFFVILAAALHSVLK